MAKYDGLRNIPRNKLLVEYSQQHPELSQKEVGKVFNIGESWVSKLLKKYRPVEGK